MVATFDEIKYNESCRFDENRHGISLHKLKQIYADLSK